jgi:hypothetical protein
MILVQLDMGVKMELIIGLLEINGKQIMEKIVISE